MSVKKRAERAGSDPLDALRRAAKSGEPTAARELGHRLCVLPDAVTPERPDATPEAERWLRCALELDPADAVAATLLAGLLGRQYDSMLLHWLWRQGSDDPGRRQAWISHATERRAEAAQWYRHALAVDPGNDAAANGLILMLLGRWPAPLDHGDDGSAAELDEERWIEAAHALLRALAVNPENALTVNNLALLYATRGQSEQATRWWRRCVELDPQNYRAAAELTRSTRGEVDFGEAERACRELAEVGDPQAVHSLALLLDATGRQSEADALLERPTARPVPHEILSGLPGSGYEWSPSNIPLPALQLARLFTEAGADRRADARRWASRAVRLADHRTAEDAMDVFISLLVGPDDGAEVRQWLERAAAEGDAAAAFNLMRLHEAQGRSEEAERWNARGWELREAQEAEVSIEVVVENTWTRTVNENDSWNDEIPY